jgi:hypothetical protein
MEQMIKGQIGQPAACMIENKISPGVEERPDTGSAQRPDQSEGRAIMGPSRTRFDSSGDAVAACV